MLEYIFDKITDEKISKKIIINVYNTKSDNDDNLYLRSHKTRIFNFLKIAYNGDFKGCESRTDLVKKTFILKEAIYENEIVAISVYNDYIGGAKCVGIGASRESEFLHKIGIIAVRKILKEDFNIPSDGYWIEASGKIEEICEETKAIPIPSVFVDTIITKIPHEIIDEWHYMAKIGKDFYQKKMFGVKDPATKARIAEYYKERQEFYKDLLENKPFIIEESFVYNRFSSEEEKWKTIVDYFIVLVNEEQLYEFTPYLIKQYKLALQNVKNIIDKGKSENLRNLKICYKDGRKAFKKISELMIIY